MQATQPRVSIVLPCRNEAGQIEECLGTIIAQEPPEGAAAVRGATVYVLQSLGPWDDQVVMPDLRGREALVAVNLLKELQVEARISFQPSPSKDRIIAQEPAPGTPIKVGMPVQLVVGE